jgi:hemerythrin-like domain-containing protein
MMDLFEMAPTFNDPFGMLRACHRRIERALTVMEQVAAREQAGTLDEPTREALRQMLHYFAAGVPRHAADEEQSLFPRLRAAVPADDPSTTRRLETLAEEHVRADHSHQELAVLGKSLLKSGRFEDPKARARFKTLVADLQRLYQEHIRVEDEELFPLAATVLNAQQQDALGTEMAARRGIDWEQQRQVVAQLESHPWSRRTALTKP